MITAAWEQDPIQGVPPWEIFIIIKNHDTSPAKNVSDPSNQIKRDTSQSTNDSKPPRITEKGQHYTNVDRKRAAVRTKEGTTHHKRQTKAIRRGQKGTTRHSRQTKATRRETDSNAGVPANRSNSPSVHTLARTTHESTRRRTYRSEPSKKTIKSNQNEAKAQVERDKPAYNFARARIPRSNSTRGCTSLVNGSAIMLADPSCAIITRFSRILSAHHNTLTP